MSTNDRQKWIFWPLRLCFGFLTAKYFYSIFYLQFTSCLRLGVYLYYLIIPAHIAVLYAYKFISLPVYKMLNHHNSTYIYVHYLFTSCSYRFSLCIHIYYITAQPIIHFIHLSLLYSTVFIYFYTHHISIVGGSLRTSNCFSVIAVQMTNKKLELEHFVHSLSLPVCCLLQVRWWEVVLSELFSLETSLMRAVRANQSSTAAAQ